MDIPEIVVRPNEPPPQVGLNVDTPITPTEPLQIDSPGLNTNPQPSVDLAEARSLKAFMGLGPITGQTREDMFNTIKDGREQALRTQAAANLDKVYSDARLERIKAMTSKVGPLTMDQINQTMATTAPVDPDTVMEGKYSQKIMTSLDIARTYLPGTFMDDVVKHAPEHVQQVQEEASTMLQKREIAVTLHENMVDDLKNQGWGGWIVDQAKGLVPGYNELKLRGLAPKTGSMDGIFLGNNLYKQTRELLDLPVPEFKARLKGILDHLKQDNPALAVQYSAAVIGQSSSEQLVNNMFTGIDVATIAGAAGGLVNKAIIKKVSSDAAKSIIEGAKTSTGLPDAIAAAGATNEAAVRKTATSIATRSELDRNLNQLVTGMRSDRDNLANNPGNLSREQHTRLLNDYDSAITGLQDVVDNTARVQRTSIQQASEGTLRTWKDRAMTDYPSLANRVNDIVDLHYNRITNLLYYTMDLRASNLELFKDIPQALKFVEEQGLIGARVQPQGIGFRVLVDKPLRETDNILRDLVAKTGKVEVPNSWVNAVFGKYRTPEDTMSLLENTNRKVAVYAVSNFQKYVHDQMRQVSDIAKGITRTDPVTGERVYTLPSRVSSMLRPLKTREVYNEFKRTVQAAVDMENPVTKKPGYYFQNPGQLEDFYQRNFQRSPTFNETMGYFAMQRAYETDRMFRSLLSIRNKGRLGVEQHRFSLQNDQGEKEYSPFFEGSVMREIPGDASKMLVVTGKRGEEKVLDIGRNTKELVEARGQVKRGEKVLTRIYDPDTFPLSGFVDRVAGERIRYVLSDRFESKAMDLSTQITRQSGGHFEYKAPFYLKMPIMLKEKFGGSERWVYLGDKTLASADNSVMGADLRNKFNNVIRLMRDKKMDEAEAAYKGNFSESWENFKSWFEPGRDENGVRTKPHLDAEHDVYLVPKGKKINQLGKELQSKYEINEATKRTNFVDGTKQGSDANQFNVRYSMERSDQPLIGFENKGTVANPLYGYKRAELVDPMVTMNRSLNNVINSVFMEDYKIFSVENWLRQNENLLAGDLDEIRSAPFAFFNHELPKFAPGVEKHVQNQALQNWYKIRQFTGIPSTFDTYLNTVTQKLVDKMYETLGPEGQRTGLEKAVTVVPLYLLSRIKDPITMIRSLAYNFKLGLFALPQVFVQSQTFMTIAALSPTHVLQGSMGALLHQWSRFVHPDMLATLDKYATKMGYKPGEWLEANKLAKQTGFFNVAGEYAGLDTALQHKFVSNNWGDFLSFGQVFFKESERNVRMGAWYTAYHEYRKVNPTGLINESARDSILQRADLLYTNMSRASSSQLHSGVMSLTTQFLSYQLRLAEMFMSKRIGETTAERTLARARLITTYSAFYGVPSAFGLVGLPNEALNYVPGVNKLPVTKMSAMQNYGYNAGEKWWSTLINEGIPAWTIGMITGVLPNYGDRYGSPGFQPIIEGLRSDKTWWDVLGGAGVSTLSGTMSGMSPFVKAVVAKMTGEGDKNPITMDNIVDMFKEVSSVNQAWKAIYAINTGKWMSRNEGYIQDISKPMAIIMAATGMQPQAQDDMFTQTQSAKIEQDAQKYALKEFTKEYHRALQADSMDQHNLHMAKAFWNLEWSNYPREKYFTAIALASKGWESQIDQMRRMYATQNVPEDRKDVRLNSYTNWLNKNKK